MKILSIFGLVAMGMAQSDDKPGKIKKSKQLSNRLYII